MVGAPRGPEDRLPLSGRGLLPHAWRGLGGGVHAGDVRIDDQSRKHFLTIESDTRESMHNRQHLLHD